MYQYKSQIKDTPTFSRFQTKLKIGPTGDKYEQEADAVANQVMSKSNIESLQMQPEEEEEELMPKLRMQPIEEEEEEMLQPKSEKGGGFASPEIAQQINSTKGNGRSLSTETNQFMSNAFGTDFNEVQIHTGSKAVQMNQQLGARAFTHDNNIYFNRREYNPEIASGKSLLAHELTHVVQQNRRISQKSHLRSPILIQRTIDGIHDLSSSRFAGNLSLESAYDIGEPNVLMGARGMHVRIIQQALIDSGQTLPTYGVDGKFEGETKTAIEGFQRSQGLSGSGVTGIIDERTMELLDQFFLNFSPMGRIASTEPAGSNTRSLTANEITEIERLRTSEVTAPPGGVLPAFQPNKNGPDSYENEVKARVLQIVNFYHANAASQELARANPANIHSWSFIEDIALQAKQETDNIFGSYNTGPAFRQGVNLFDARDTKESQFSAGGAAFEDDRVNWRVQKIIQGSIHPIDVDHGAVQSRAPETTILNRVQAQVVAAKRAELILIDKWWPGFADPTTSSVFLQRMKGTNDAENRDFAWQTFQTMVHEYIHTLEHPDSRTYRELLQETHGGKTYREGMTEYFTKIILDSVTYTPQLRTLVEGAYHDLNVIHTIPVYSGYREAANAEAVVGLVGIRNAMAAFFLGQVRLIGGP